ncbi:uncharacterized protein LY79DRAFT_401846 [Colletotrichum navitas]|uniref:Uncharacterized protein n=1 Tax=Colletotrichum navitas TaxID=681940 RepID=A0AAD8UZF9_9PEZI|nr:uncharacterized protein LY79DRAFT_401846 [Colletotrichum navitas]KAK1573612.1 hypothetical protein LY79DRAFT_401846 [Colletotrichum navitas]
MLTKHLIYINIIVGATAHGLIACHHKTDVVATGIERLASTCKQPGTAIRYWRLLRQMEAPKHARGARVLPEGGAAAPSSSS